MRYGTGTPGTGISLSILPLRTHTFSAMKKRKVNACATCATTTQYDHERTNAAPFVPRPANRFGMFRQRACASACRPEGTQLHRFRNDFDLYQPLASFLGLAEPAETEILIKRRSNRLNFRATLTAGASFPCPLNPDMGTKRPLRFEAALIGAGSVYAVAVASIASAAAFFSRRFFAVMLSIISRSESSRERTAGFAAMSPVTAGSRLTALDAASSDVWV